MRHIAAIVVTSFCTTLLSGQDPAKPVRIASGVSGHVHPAICISKKGTIVVIYSQSDMKDLRITRSTDGGASWTKAEPFEPTAKLSIYPGSLTALFDGRIVHAWNTWYGEGKSKSRWVQYATSSDEGKTWGEVKDLPKNPKAESIIRHPFIELEPRIWLMPLADQTIVYNPQTEKSAPFRDGRNHGLVPIVVTPKPSASSTGGPVQLGTVVSGAGDRSTDGGKTWKRVEPFPDIAKQGWRHEMIAVSNGWIIASDIDGNGIGGGTRLRFVVSKDAGLTWGFKNGLEYYNPGRPISGRACPRTIEIDAKTLGTVFYDGTEVFFLRTPIFRFN